MFVPHNIYMTEQLCVSVIVPFYNAQFYIKNCLDVLSNQDFDRPFEVIMINDASTDNSKNIVEKCTLKNIRLYSIKSNGGPAKARNLGITQARGEYIFFLDVDDAIDPKTLTELYNVAKETLSDFVFCDSKWIENYQNQRSNIFSYHQDKVIKNSELTETMKKRLYNPNYMGGPLGCKGRLIRRSIIVDNNIMFEEQLRYLEDEIFMWDFLAFVKNAKYIRKQLYTYYVHPNVNTAVIDGLNRGFPVSKFKLIKKHIENSFKQRGCLAQDVEKFGDQAFIYFIINVLISYSKSMIQGKVGIEDGIKCRRKIIDSILSDIDVLKAVHNYSRSKEESVWIPRAIAWRSRWLLEFLCTRRAKKILQIRRKYK